MVPGGGFVGLWSAIRIKQADPACDVVVLEQDICGGGASGRNGGMVLSWWPKLASLVSLCGDEQAVRLGRASEAAIDELRSFCEAHEMHLSLILTSPLRRAHETAKPVAAALRAELIVAPWLSSGMHPHAAIEEMITACR